jgi:hypothetical protein
MNACMHMCYRTHLTQVDDRLGMTKHAPPHYAPTSLHTKLHTSLIYTTYTNMHICCRHAHACTPRLFMHASSFHARIGGHAQRRGALTSLQGKAHITLHVHNTANARTQTHQTNICHAHICHANALHTPEFSCRHRRACTESQCSHSAARALRNSGCRACGRACGARSMVSLVHARNV